MARKNSPEAKTLTYAEMHAERIKNGEAATKPEELDELDKLEVQEKILDPGFIEIPTTDGEILKIRKALGPADVKRRRAVDCLKTLAELLVMETIKLSGDPEAETNGWLARNLTYLRMAAGRMNVQVICLETVNQLTGGRHSTDDFADGVLRDSALELFMFYLKESTEAAQAPKNSQQ